MTTASVQHLTRVETSFTLMSSALTLTLVTSTLMLKLVFSGFGLIDNFSILEVRDILINFTLFIGAAKVLKLTFLTFLEEM